jgi:hypothetical protein
MAEYLFLSRTLFYLDIMSHLADHEAWQALDRFDPEFARDSRSVRHGLSTNSFRHHNTIIASTLVGQFLSCLTISLLTNI